MTLTGTAKTGLPTRRRANQRDVNQMHFQRPRHGDFSMPRWMKLFKLNLVEGNAKFVLVPVQCNISLRHCW